MESKENTEEPMPMSFSIIQLIIYIIGFVICVITFLSIVNYILNIYYYIKELIITNENIYDTYSIKLKDIKNYKLINYIKIFNEKMYDKTIKFSNENYNCYDIKKLKFDEPVINEENKDNNNTKINILEYDFNKLFDKYLNLSYILIDLKNKNNIITDVDNNDLLIKNFPKNIELENEDFNKLSDEDLKLLYNFGGSKYETQMTKEKEETNIRYVYGIYKYNNKDYIFKIIVEKAGNNCNITDNDVKKINNSLYKDILSENSENSGNSENKSFYILGKNGIFGEFKLKEDINNNISFYDNFGDVFGYALNRLYILFPNNLYYSYDKDASNLYILANNKLYELVFSLVFIIFLIISILITIDIIVYIFGIFIKNNKETFKSNVYKIFDIENYKMISIMIINQKYIHLIIIPIIIVIYCIIHSVIYYYLFINRTYYEISNIYNMLIKPDEIIRNEVIKILNKKINVKIPSVDEYKINKKLLLLFQDICYGKDIDISKAKYSVIDIINNDYNIQLKNFEEKMLKINRHFTYNKNNYEANYYTKEFFEEYKKIYNEIKNSPNDSLDVEINNFMILLLTIYIYIIEWNDSDPYILIKLNKLIFGRVANIGIREIDEDIENTLTFRDLIPYNLNNHKHPDIKKIYNGVNSYLSVPPVPLVEDDLKNLNLFEKEFKNIINYNDIKINPEYPLNIYLAFEMGLNILIILSVLIILKLMSNNDSTFDKNITYVQTLTMWIISQIGISIFGVVNILRFI